MNPDGRPGARLERRAIVLALCAAWLLAHPYRGVIHDARFYAGQAFSRLYPTAFSLDMFFLPGSQEEFSLFSLAYAPLIRSYGLDVAAMVLFALAQLLWLGGAVRFAHAMFTGAVERYAALAGAIMLPAWYGSELVLQYAESFLTPRLFAEAATLHALAWLLQGRTIAAAAAIAVSGMFHPLYGATGAAVVLTYLSLQDRRWLVGAGAGLVGIAVLAGAGVPPLNRLFQYYDPDWLDVVIRRNRIVFPGEWGTRDWSRFSLQAFLMFAAWRATTGAPRRLLAAILVCVAALLSVSAGATSAGEVFITQLQLWRITWISSVSANLATGFLLVTFWNGGQRLLTAMITLTWCWLFYGEVAIVVLALTVAAYVWVQRNGANPVRRDLAVLAMWVAGLTLAVLLAYDLFGRNSATLRAARLVPIGVLDSFMPQAAFAAGLLAWAVARWASRLRPLVATALATCFAVVAVAEWDRRDDWQKWIEAAGSNGTPVDSLIGQTDQVMWMDGLAETWFVLRRPSYFNFHQGAGVLFSRETSMVYKERSRVVGRLDPRDNFLMEASMKRLMRIPSPDRETLVTTCAAAPELSALILYSEVPGVPSVRWRTPALRRTWVVDERGAQRIEQYDAVYVYRCSDLRQPAGSP